MTKSPKEQAKTIYNQLGYADRYDYFTVLSEKFGIPIMKVIFKAEELGKEQDFNKLLDWVEETSKCYSIKQQ